MNSIDLDSLGQRQELLSDLYSPPALEKLSADHHTLKHQDSFAIFDLDGDISGGSRK